MITIFSSPKAFKGHVGVIQSNAVKSWTLLRPKPEIFLIGNEKGTAGICKRLKLKHIPKIKCNESGTPLVNDIFEKAQHYSAHKFLCYVNSDIILMDDFMKAVEKVVGIKRNFLMIGQRWDLEMRDELNFKPGWEKELKIKVAKEGKLQHPAGVDYFAFSRGLWDKIPPFAIGRTIWDNWLVYQARLAGMPVIDASRTIRAIHQNHSGNTIGGEAVWKGPEAAHNLELAGQHTQSFSLHDATHVLNEKGIKRALAIKYLVRRMRTIHLFHTK